ASIIPVSILANSFRAFDGKRDSEPRLNTTSHRFNPICLAHSNLSRLGDNSHEMIRHERDQPSPQHDRISLPKENSAVLRLLSVLARWRPSSSNSNSAPSRNRSISYLI